MERTKDIIFKELAETTHDALKRIISDLNYAGILHFESSQALHKIKAIIRPLAKLNIEFKITDTGYKVKAQSEAFSAVAVPIRNDFKAFDTSDNMFIENTVA